MRCLGQVELLSVTLSQSQLKTKTGSSQTPTAIFNGLTEKQQLCRFSIKLQLKLIHCFIPNKRHYQTHVRN